MRPLYRLLAIGVLLVVAGCSERSTHARSPAAKEGAVSSPQPGPEPKAREVTIPTPTSRERESGDLGEACRRIWSPENDRLTASRPARHAADKDQRWELFYYALVDATDGVYDWFDPGGDERVINYTCDPGLQDTPGNTVTIYCDLREPCRPPR